MPDTSSSGKHAGFGRAWRYALCGLSSFAIAASAIADECAPEPQGEGRVAAAIDGRTLRLDDGRIVRLSGLAPLRGVSADQAMKLLAGLAAGRDISLHGESDTPDRYGRQRVWAFASGQTQSLQAMLLAAGGGLRDIAIMPSACRASLELAEATARNSRSGRWSASESAKNAESPDDISSEIGHFTLVEGRVLSVRTSGGMTYLNFGRRLTQDFAAMVPGRTATVFEATGQALKGFEGKRVRVRGYVMRRGGPRIEISNAEQIEVIGRGAVATVGKQD